MISAVAAAAITPDALRTIVGGSDPSAAPTASPEARTYERIADPTDALSLEVPEEWYGGRSTYRDGTGTALGPGLTAGTDPDLTRSPSRPGVFLGASSAQAQRSDLEGASEARLYGRLSQLVRAPDWTMDDCTLVHEKRMADERTDLLGVYRLWEDCRGSSSHFYDMFFTNAAGEYVGTLQLQLPDKSSGDVARHVMDSASVAPERLSIPTSSRTGSLTP